MGRLVLSVSGRGLPYCRHLNTTKSDPFLVIFAASECSAFRYLGRTETVKSSLNPDWAELQLEGTELDTPTTLILLEVLDDGDRHCSFVSRKTSLTAGNW